MKYIPLTMIRCHMRNIPWCPCPPGYRVRPFTRGDQELWASVETGAGEFGRHTEAFRVFTEEFGTRWDDLEDRSYFLEDRHCEAIGTATAWQGNLDGQRRGRVAWLGIVRPYQGQKLSKPLLSAVMARLATEHADAYLVTHTTSLAAVALYLGFGFVPYVRQESCQEGWRLMESALDRKIIS